MIWFGARRVRWDSKPRYIRSKASKMYSSKCSFFGDLQALGRVQRRPEPPRRGKQRLRIPRDVNELGTGKQLRQHADPARMRRGLENQRLSLVVGQRPDEPEHIPLPAGQHLRRNPFHVQQFHVARRLVGEHHPPIRRRTSQVAQGKLVLLRVIGARQHVVHRPLPGQQQVDQAGAGCNDSPGSDSVQNTRTSWDTQSARPGPAVRASRSSRSANGPR